MFNVIPTLWPNILRYYSLDALITLRDNTDDIASLELIKSIYIDKLKEGKSKAVVHLVNLGEDYDYFQANNITDLEVMYPGLTGMMKRGDIIEDISVSGYRSQGVYFFDGNGVIHQNYKYDDYGTPPAEFKLITEFPPGYWDVNSDSELTINKWFERTESQFYWHSDCTTSPVGSQVAEHIINKIKSGVHDSVMIYIEEKGYERTNSNKDGETQFEVRSRLQKFFKYVIFEHNGTKYLFHYGDGYRAKHNIKLCAEALVISDNSYYDYSEVISLLEEEGISKYNVISDDYF